MVSNLIEMTSFFKFNKFRGNKENDLHLHNNFLLMVGDKYFTVNSISEGMYKEKGSKFLAYLTPCFTEVEAFDFLEKLRNEHSKARHFCYAYRFGINGDSYRVNDDGEPSNSAGQPIYGQILSHDLTNVLIVVIRYFGGVKLGVGGLVQAYKTAAKEAIEHAKIMQKQILQHFRLEFDYNVFPTIMIICKQMNIEHYNHQMQERCTISVDVSIAKKEEFQRRLENLSVIIVDKGIY